jgi:hypothetical protein
MVPGQAPWHGGPSCGDAWCFCRVRDGAPLSVSGEGVDHRAAALDLVVAAISLAGLVASLSHVVKVFVGGGGKGIAGLSGGFR